MDLDMSWRTDSRKVAEEKKALDEQIMMIIASITEAQERAKTLDEKRVLWARLNGLKSWLPMK